MIPQRADLDGPVGVYVYALYDAADNVIYVGQSCNVVQRVKSHRAQQPWASEMAGYKVLGGPFTRFHALIVEKGVIKELQPRHNIYGSRQTRAVPPDGYCGRRKLPPRRLSEAQLELLAEARAQGSSMVTTGRRRSA